MSASTKTRNRAVRLTPDALKALQAALDARWRAAGLHPRLTWEARAELMGMSVATARKVLDNGGVDRAMLVLAFKNLGLAWDESSCERVSTLVPGLEASTAEEPALAQPAKPTEPEPTRPERRSPWRGAPAAALLLLVVASLAAWRVAAPGAAKEPQWVAALERIRQDAFKRYDDADYVGADRRLQELLRDAREHDSTRVLCGALKLSGDIKVVWGRWNEARREYESAVVARKNMKEPPWPSLLESLGVVEMELKDYDAAKTHFDECLAAYRASGQTTGVAQAYRSLGTLALRQGELDRADALFRQSLAILAEHPEPGTHADVRGQQGLVLLARDRPAEARAALNEALAHWREEAHPRWIAVCETYLARVDEREGRLDDACARLSRSLATFQRLNEVARVAEVSARLARLARQAG